MKPLAFGLLVLICCAGPAVADMAMPWEQRVEIRTTVLLAEPLPDHMFFAVNLPQSSEWVAIAFAPNARTPVKPHGYRGTLLVAVPKAFAERFKTPNEVRDAIRTETPVGVARVELESPIQVSAWDSVAVSEREVVIRRGADGGAVFEVIQQPHTALSWKVRVVGLVFAAALIWWGWRWIRRRTRTASPPET